MKKRSKVLKIGFLLVALSIGICSVFADTLTYVVSTGSGAHAIKQGTCSGTCSGYSGSLDFFCIDGPLVVQGIVGATATEKAVEEVNFIVAKVLKDLNITETTGLIANSNYSLYTQAEEALSARASSDEATKWYNTYNAYKNGFNPTISALSTFTLNGNNYESTATISNLGDYAEISCSSSVGTATLSGATVNVKVPKNSVTQNTSVTVTCNASYEYYMSQLFDGQDNSQDLAIKPKRYTGNKELVASKTIEKTKGSITIKKQYKNSKGETNKLPGVKFVVKNSKGKTINLSGVEEENKELTTDNNGEIKITNIEISNTESENVYTIEEIETLSGYVKSKEIVTVTLSLDRPSQTKTIINDTVQVKISKTDATGKKELKGAKLSILDKDGKVLNKCVFDDENDLITYSDGEDAKACTWASTDKEKVLEGLPVGKYYLVEDLAPEGYKKSTEKILIEIKEDGAVKDKVVMKNALEVPVPDTLSARSALLLAVAMFDIALGIGIVLYVRKNKVEE